MSDLSTENLLAGIPAGLRDPLVNEFNKLLRNFREGRWEPAELNGGKLSEIVYSILRGHVDGAFPDGPYKPRNMVDACRGLEAATTFPRSVRIQIPRMLVSLYEIRNNRNVGHVGADVDPNHMDAGVVVGMAKWVVAELVRIFHGVTPEEATVAVDAIVERSIPVVWAVNGGKRVLASGLNTGDKTLLLLYSCAEPCDATTLAGWLEYSNTSRYRRTVLPGLHKRDLIHFERDADLAQLTPLGIRYVEETLELNLS